MSEGAPELPSVLVVGGPIDGHDVKLNPGLTIIVGSGRLATLRLDHPEIELAHVKIIWDDVGVSMVDNGSSKGTWVNGEPVETAGLLDGDVIEFVAPDSKVQPRPPKIKLRIPKGSVPDPPPPPPPAPGEVAPQPAAPKARAVGKGRAARRRRSPISMPDPKLLAIGAGALLVLLGAGWAIKRFFFTGPHVDAIQPAQVEMGQEVVISGDRFASNAADNKVFFGSVAVAPTAASGSILHVRVPDLPNPGPVAVAVETSIGRSNSVSLAALAPLRVTSVDPPGAQPGDELVLGGSGFGEGLSVTVGGAVATVKQAEPQSLRVEMPQLTGAPGTRLPVVVSAGGRSTSPVDVLLGRLPLVTSVQPTRGVAGDLVRVRGAGFTALTTVVRFDGRKALVAAGDDSELLVVVPPSTRPQPEALVPLRVEARGKATDAPAFALLRLVEGAWVPRFVAGVLEEGRPGQATVGTELVPLLLLSGKDESRSTAERALAVAKALDAAVDRARVGHEVAFEAREEPEITVALVGAPDRLIRVLPEDAAAYEAPPGVPARGAPPPPLVLARHWAALLTDTVAIGTSGSKPRATATLGPPWSPAFTQLRAALPWQYASGVSSARVVGLSPALRELLLEAALRVP